VLPGFILFITAIAIWIFRKAHIRIQWFIGVTGVLSSWIMTYMIDMQIPASLKLPIWEPENLLHTSLILNIDEISWPICMGIVSMLLAIVLTRPSREKIYPFQEFVAILIFTGLAMISVMARNILSIVILWTLMDGFVFTMHMLNQESKPFDSKVIGWSMRNVASTFLLILAYVLNNAQTGNSPFESGEVTGIVLLMVMIATFLRMPFQMFSKISDSLGWFDTGSRMLVNLFPVLTGMTGLAHLLHSGYQEEFLSIIRILGMFFMALSVFSFLFAERLQTSTVGFLSGLLGIALIGETYSDIASGSLVATSAVLSIYVLSTLSFVKFFVSWNLFFPFTVAAMMIGLPESVGGLLGQNIYNIFVTTKAYGMGLLIALSLVFLSIVLLRESIRRREAWISSDSLTRISYYVGLILFASNGIIIGLTRLYEYEIRYISSFLLMLILLGGAYLGLRDIRINTPVIRPVLSQSLRKRIISYSKIFPNVQGIIRGIGTLFEGETGMLWTFVILLVLVLAIVNLGL